MVWNSFCQPKHRVFFWLLLRDRLSTRNILKRKNMVLQSYNCVLCDLSSEETVHHLFLQCEFAKQCWQMLGVDIPFDIEFPEAMVFLRDAIQSQFFMEAVILLCWAIWMTRNAFIFRNLQPQLSLARSAFVAELKLLTHRAHSRRNQPFNQWLQLLL